MDKTADIIEQLREMAEKGDGLPQTYYNQLILTAMIAQSRQLQNLIDTTRSIETKLTAIEQDQKWLTEIDHQVQQMNSRLSRRGVVSLRLAAATRIKDGQLKPLKRLWDEKRTAGW